MFGTNKTELVTPLTLVTLRSLELEVLRVGVLLEVTMGLSVGNESLGHYLRLVASRRGGFTVLHSRSLLQEILRNI